MITFLRWHSGYGGDTILSSILSQNPDIKSNIVLSTMFDTHAMNLAASNLSHPLVCLARNNPKINDEVTNTIEALKLNDARHLLKTHSYDTFFNTCDVIDLVSTNSLLPFTSLSSLRKTYTYVTGKYKDWGTDSRIVELLTQAGDKKELDRYMLYLITQAQLSFNKTSKKFTNTIKLDDWVYNSKCHIGFTYDTEIRDKWIEANTKFFPGSSHPDAIMSDIISKGVIEGLSYSSIRKRLL
jgi:hypothetical protein